MEEKVLTGRIYDIQGFSGQDGPGIRTTAFLKGCPLRCPWCHSPESQAFYPQLSWINMRCLGTEACDSRCIKACPKGAIELGDTRLDAKTMADLQMVHVNRDICDNCGKCAEVCHPHSLYICGEDYTCLLYTSPPCARPRPAQSASWRSYAVSYAHSNPAASCWLSKSA